jgi:hypothetical protein
MQYNTRRDDMKTFWRAILIFILAITAIAFITIFTSNRPKSYDTSDKVIAELKNRGFDVDVKDVEKDILDGERKWLTIDQKENISIFIYYNKKEMEEDADCISIDGCSYDGFMKKVNVSWSSYPHFYKINNIIVLYVGENRHIIDTLEAICGIQFAGYNP